MNRDELKSQLSAMFDGELPAAECELLSRRLMREEQLRASWSRYAVIGAALRAEPVARVRPDFAQRVSAALVAPPAVAGGRQAGTQRLLGKVALGAGLAASVAGVAIMLLRNGLPAQQEALTASVPGTARVSAPLVAVSGVDPGVDNAGFTQASLASTSLPAAMQVHEPVSYIVPPSGTGAGLAVPASLANYVVAHSEVSSPLVRRSLLSALIGSEAVQPASAVSFMGTSQSAAAAGSAGFAQSDGRR